MLFMVVANLTFTQAAASPGPGISMIGTAAAGVVTLSNQLNGNVKSWNYELLDAPVNSALVPGVLGMNSTANFSPDNPATPGCYRIKLTVIGYDNSTSSMIRNFAVATPEGWILPSFRATCAEMNFNGNVEGWEFYLNTIFLSLSGGGGTDELVNASAADTTPGVLDAKLVAGAGIARTILNPGANEQYQTDVVGNADGSITVNANDIQVGVLAADAQHGVRGGGTQHAVVIAGGANGFMSGADKTKLDGVVAGGGSLILWGDDNIATSTTPRFLSPYYDDSVAETTPAEFRLTRAGDLQKMRVRHSTAGVGAANLTYTLLVNGTPTALTLTMSNTAQDGVDLANSVAVAAGDIATLRVTKSTGITTSPDNVTCTVEYL